MQPVLEVYASDDFALWPVARSEAFGYLALHGEMTTPEIGTAVRRIAECNDIDPDPRADDDRPARPPDPVGSFLHGLLTFERPFAAGGLRVMDSTTGVVFLPGCCNGLEDWRDWHTLLHGSGPVSFGHDPDPTAELSGNTVRLTVDTARDDSPVIEITAAELRPLLDRVERDLAGFLRPAADWAVRNVADRSASVTAALARAVGMPVPGTTRFDL
ncbi:hypothetical protein [Streptomyces sp. SAI-170]|uniref:hypothetical protein n=1 Tax=Streptomyces sp. SAI-170 TaxID=3377729 RepID=UPI003C7DA770